MPRPLVTGNGSLLAAFDRHLSLRDLYWPYVGLFNHLSGNQGRIGLWSDGRFAWTADPGWSVRNAYEEDTLTTASQLEHPGLELALQVSDCVHPGLDILLRRFVLANNSSRPREVRLFLAHDFHISESDIADTAFYNPFLDAVVHYKRDVFLLVAARAPDGGGLSQYAMGIKGFGGAEGTWRDAEDGHLSMNPIAQGSVDSVLAVTVRLGPGESAIVRAWLCAGAALEQVAALHHQAERGHAVLMDEAVARWRRWCRDRSRAVEGLPDPIPGLFRRSLLTVMTNVDRRGAIIAANDSDIMQTARAHYSYAWPRDGALTAAVLDRVDCADVARRFFRFCRRVLPHDRPALFHKYGPEGTWGATWHPWVLDGEREVPFQEDSTALVLWALGRHSLRHEIDSGLRHLFADLVVPCADFVAAYRDEATGLPLPSYDLWEERRGIHAYTCAAVWAGLRESASLADRLGHPRAAAWREAAAAVQRGFAVHFWDESARRFARRLTGRGAALQRDLTIDSALLSIATFGLLPTDDPRVEATLRAVISRLWNQAPVGGLARYEEDYYFRRSEDVGRVPGNPWFICTLWAAQWYLARARRREDLDTGLGLLQWVARHALPTGILPEQLHPETGEPLSVAPLTWSHAEFMWTALEYAERLAAFADSGNPVGARS